MDWDQEERDKHNAKLVKAMRATGLDAGDAVDAISWMNTADAGKTVERLRDELSEVSKADIAKQLTTISEQLADAMENRVAPRVRKLVELMKLDDKLKAEGLGTKEGARAKVYRDIAQVKQNYRARYDEALASYEGHKAKS